MVIPFSHGRVREARRGAMKNMNEIKLDRFFTDTRIRLCYATRCRFNVQASCNLKSVSVDANGTCQNIEPKEKPVTEDENPMLQI
jgi:hypothetical protein